MLAVTSAEYVGGYRIRIAFNTGERGVVDLREALWGPVFEPLTDTELFKRFKVSQTFHTLTWEGGADLAPEYLHEKMVEQAAATASHSTRR